MRTKIRKRFYLPLIFVCWFVALHLFEQASSKSHPPYVAELNGVAAEFYQEPRFSNGDSLLLVKIKEVEHEDFKKFTRNHKMTPIGDIGDIIFFGFHADQEWWPYPETFKLGEKFYCRDLDQRWEFFACLIDNICYVSYKTW